MQDSHPLRRPLYKRHEPAQLEIGDGLIQTQALLGILSTARLVSRQESLGQPVKLMQRAKMSQAQKPKMSGKVEHIEQRIVLATLIQIKTGERDTRARRPQAEERCTAQPRIHGA